MATLRSLSTPRSGWGAVAHMVGGFVCPARLWPQCNDCETTACVHVAQVGGVNGGGEGTGHCGGSCQPVRLTSASSRTMSAPPQPTPWSSWRIRPPQHTICTRKSHAVVCGAFPFCYNLASPQSGTHPTWRVPRGYQVACGRVPFSREKIFPHDTCRQSYRIVPLFSFSYRGRPGYVLNDAAP